jgi:hypothetical protein
VAVSSIFLEGGVAGAQKGVLSKFWPLSPRYFVEKFQKYAVESHENILQKGGILIE